MEIIGDDKKIRALFSEPKLADEQATPSFTGAWNRAQSRAAPAARGRSAFRCRGDGVRLFVAVVGPVVVTVFTATRDILGIAQMWRAGELWSRRQDQTKVLRHLTSNGTASVERLDRRAAQIRGAALTVAGRATRSCEATTITSWQSPIATLLTSQNDDLFKSLPQLNENANELKSFCAK